MSDPLTGLQALMAQDPMMALAFGQSQAYPQIDFQSMYAPMGQAIEAQAPPTPQQVPPPINPFAAMGSTFAATLADQLGARGAMAQNQNRLTSRQDEIAKAQQANLEQQNQFQHDKQIERLNLRSAIIEQQAKQALAANDYILGEQKLAKVHAIEMMKQRLIDQREAKKQESMTNRAIKVAQERGNQTRLSDQKRAEATTKAGNDPRSKALLAQAGALAALTRDRAAKSKQLVATAVGSYQDPTEYQARADSIDAAAEVEIQRYYEDALKAMGSAPDTTGAKPAKKAAASDFWK
jgi:hypothetical protein